jgi:hypothetical protein
MSFKTPVHDCFSGQNPLDFQNNIANLRLVLLILLAPFQSVPGRPGIRPYIAAQLVRTAVASISIRPVQKESTPPEARVRDKADVLTSTSKANGKPVLFINTAMINTGWQILASPGPARPRSRHPKPTTPHIMDWPVSVGQGSDSLKSRSRVSGEGINSSGIGLELDPGGTVESERYGA